MSNLIIGGVIGFIVGWSGYFFYRVKEKGSVKWAWLLCKPWPLSYRDRRELNKFYISDAR